MDLGIIAWLLDGKRCSERPYHEQQFGMFSSTSPFTRRQQGLEMELIVDHHFVIKSLSNMELKELLHLVGMFVC